ncbi:MAG TPA: hypothetical protein VLA49_01515 [Anaerolineales bacterium]|nr:hypothetical protein [Anaerolineales bacterium]
MKNHGWATASEFLGDRIVYRNLVPLDARLPGLAEIAPSLGLPPGRTPRKHELDYARVVARLLEEARALDQPGQPIRRLVFVGDTELLDGSAFANLCRVTGWPGLAFIGDETDEPAAYRLGEAGAGRLYLANRWAALEAFDMFCEQAGQPVGEGSGVVIDLDKTILGARRRNSKVIDWARSRAMEATITEVLGESFEAQAFGEVYRLFNQVEFHPFTSDNQDYLAYVCLMTLAGAAEAAQLAEAVRRGELESFEQFIEQVDRGQDKLPVPVRDVHREVVGCVWAGDPTPFKAFRRREYEVTVSKMGCLEGDAPVEALLEREITLTEEVRQMALEWQRRGALIFGLSDKPDEASLPTREQAERGCQPLHRTRTHAVGA